MANADLQLNGSPSLIAKNDKNLVIGTSGAGDVICQLGSATGSFKVQSVSGTNLFQVDQDGAVSGYTGDIVYTDASFDIRASTSDAADSSRIAICGGGGTGTNGSRGANFIAYGNENATAGNAYIASGNAAAAEIVLRLFGAGGGLSIINAAGSTNWSFYESGNLVQGGSAGGSLILSKTGTGVYHTTDAAISAAGSSISDATQLAYENNRVTTVAAGTGVKLMAPTQAGIRVCVINLGANQLKLYPASAGASINAGAGGAAVNVEVGEMAICFAFSTTLWAVAIAVAP